MVYSSKGKRLNPGSTGEAQDGKGFGPLSAMSVQQPEGA